MTIAGITGASGLIGSNFIRLFGSKFRKIYSIGRKKINSSIENIEYDLESNQCLKLPKMDVLFHFGGQTSSKLSQSEIIKDSKINIVGFLQILHNFTGVVLLQILRICSFAGGTSA